MSRVHGAFYSDQDFLDETLGRGAGDGDAYGFPGDEPSKEDLNNAKPYVGLSKPKVERVVEQPDPYSYQKWKGAKELGISISDMADTPDEMSDHSDDQGWDL